MGDPKFGKSRSIADALRTATLINPRTGAGGSGSGELPPGSGGNRILLYRADGSALVEYPPTQAGLGDALAAASYRDTVWLPSIEIALAAGCSVPEGVALVGIDENALLSFSGFSGTAITLAADAMCYNFRVVMASSGATAIGVDARFANALVEQMAVEVSGGSTDNIAVWAGATSGGGGGAFPSTSILDNFNRADEGPPPSSSWILAAEGAGGTKVVSNACAADLDGSPGYGTWGMAVGPDCEVWGVIGTVGDGCRLNARSDATNVLAGYNLLLYQNVGSWWLSVRRPGGSWTDDYAVPDPVSGSAFGMRLVGSDITLYYRDGSGGTWTLIQSLTDSENLTDGYIALFVDAFGTFDDFGGGAFAGGGAARPAWVVDCRELIAADTGAIGLRVSDEAYAFNVHPAATTDVVVDADATLRTYGLQYGTATISGTLNALPGDRAVWDTTNYSTRHARDIDEAAYLYHRQAGVSAGDVETWNGAAWILTTGLTSQVIALAKLTPDGSDGSFTVTNGIVTAYTAPT